MSSRSAESVKDLLPRSYQFLRELTSSIRGKVGFSVTLVFVLMATIGPVVLPLEFMSFDLEKAYSPPSFEHPLGCDYFGRDVLRMIIAGSREVLMIGILAALLTTAIALIVGLTAGFMSGVVDATLMTIADIVLTIPGFPLLLVLASTVLSKAMDPLSLAGVLSITAWAGLSRSIRSQVLAIKEREFIEAARCLGLRKIQIIFVEILPNLLPYIVTIIILGVTGAIYAQIGLFTLGVAPYSSINWGHPIRR